MRHRRKLSVLLVGLLAAGGLVVFAASPASAHQCWEPGSDHEPADAPQGYEPGDSLPEGYWWDGDQMCKDTPVMPNWRDGYIPLFELEDREDPQQRHDAQRWREECNPRQNEYHQMCQWSYGGFSLFENRDGSGYSPNEWHLGFAANHCFIFEFAHQCEDHEPHHGEGTHDAHGGAIYVDVCLTPNPESKYCGKGIEDTQAGVVIMDHNPCGTFVPIVACTDEYHVIRPFDTAYTGRQMENTVTATELIIADPARYVCGTHASGASCRNNVNMVLGNVPQG